MMRRRKKTDYSLVYLIITIIISSMKAFKLNLRNQKIPNKMFKKTLIKRPGQKKRDQQQKFPIK